MELVDVAQVGGAAVTSGALAAFLFRHWVSSVSKRLDDHSRHLHQIELMLAEMRGKEDLVWREINTDKQKIVKLQSSLEKSWETLSKMAQPRISDLFKEDK